MSLTPVDESDGVSGPSDDADNDAGASVLERVATAVRSVGDALRRRVGSLTGRSAEPDSDSDTERAAGVEGGLTDADLDYPGLTAEVIEGPTGEVSDLPERPRPAHAVDRGRPRSDRGVPDREGPDVDRPDLEASWDDGRLTLESREGSDARISSDRWEDVEP